MNGILSFQVISDYVQNRIDINHLKKISYLESKLQSFDPDLFVKFVKTYKYCKTQTGAWDEDTITQMLIRDIKTTFPNKNALTFNIFKAKGSYETNFGDIAFIIRFNYKTGKEFEGYGFIEAKRDYANHQFQYHELKQKQIDRFLQNTSSSFYCFYSHDAFFPVVKTDYLDQHLKCLSLPNINHLNYQLLSSVITPITFQHQFKRFLNGYDLDYGNKPKDIAYGHDEEYLPSNIFVIDQFEPGMTPTPTPTPNQKIYEKFDFDFDIDRKKRNNNDNNNDSGFGMRM